MRIPYTGPLPLPTIIPKSANTPTGAAHALVQFLLARDDGHSGVDRSSTLLLTGAGISVSSGLADYRGTGGTYTLNKTYRPIYYSEFITSHEARKRYWARSFLGWTNLHRARPNAAHYAVRTLGSMGILKCVVTQNVDSFHSMAHPDLPTLELHGYLRSLICIHCNTELGREDFQKDLHTLNPAWASFLERMLTVGALESENPEERKAKGLKSNPDGDVDVPNAPYSTFRYPACPSCLEDPPRLVDGSKALVEIDKDGAWSPRSTAGVLKPAVVMFGESIAVPVKDAVNQAVDGAARVLVVGSSLATYSAWRLVKRAKEQRKPIAILNLGGVRGEETFFQHLRANGGGREGVRCNESASKVLPMVVETLQRTGIYQIERDAPNHGDRTDLTSYEWTPFRTPS